MNNDFPRETANEKTVRTNKTLASHITDWLVILAAVVMAWFFFDMFKGLPTPDTTHHRVEKILTGVNNMQWCDRSELYRYQFVRENNVYRIKITEKNAFRKPNREDLILDDWIYSYEQKTGTTRIGFYDQGWKRYFSINLSERDTLLSTTKLSSTFVYTLVPCPETIPAGL